MARDPLVIAIEQEMQAQGKTRAELGRLLGLDSSQVTRIFSEKSPTRRIQMHELRQIEAWLGRTGTRKPDFHSMADIVPLPGMVPLYGWVGAASEHRLVLAEQNALGFIPMHPAQLHFRNAFALQVADDCMRPRYEPGENIYLAPNQWPRIGQDIVIVTTEGNGFLKRFLGRDAERVLVEQLNPVKQLKFPLATIEAVHAVVGRG